MKKKILGQIRAKKLVRKYKIGQVVKSFLMNYISQIYAI